MSSVSTSGVRIRSRRRALREAVELLSSMRFAISLLTVIAIASVIGTVLKQNEPYPNYVNQFGPFWADVFRALTLPRVYSAWWFLLILAFLVVSTSLCILRNAPKMLADMRAWREHVREGSLRAFHHRDEFDAPADAAAVTARLAALAQNRGFRIRAFARDGGATLIAAKAGAGNKIGYILAHTAIVIICIGGLLDGDMMIRLQMWFGGKSPIRGNAVISEIGPEHRLPASNPGFRGNAFVPEGATVGTAILNIGDGALIQDLPFSVTLRKFTVEHYSTGMPKLFASDIVVTDRSTGKQTAARVEVNKPFVYDGVAIYQSSFEDGGSRLKLTGFPMRGADAKSFALSGTVGENTRLTGAGADYTVEFTDFRLMNIETVTDASGKRDARGVGTGGGDTGLRAELGNAKRMTRERDLRNVGPSVQYKLRDANGQAREFSNYMLPVTLEGQSVFLAGVRTQPDEPFRYLRIPADAQGSVNDWMRLRAALQSSAMRGEAARRFALLSMPGDDRAVLRAQLAESARRALDLFAGATDIKGAPAEGPGGFAAVAGFLQKSVPEGEREKAADVLMKIINSATWELWQLARAQDGLAAPAIDAAGSRWLQTAINSLSDSFFYGAPVYLQLVDFQQVQASVFQLTRAPGKNIVYLGSLLLVLGVFSMFYVRERRWWLWIRPQADGSAQGAHVLTAMSTTRRTLDFDREFERLKQDVRAAAGAPGAATAAAAEQPPTK
ncbi:cytochrome c biogenesis protein ResB [Ralstonia pseudosolanacearum]|uniref:Cytochrome c biogenesis protein ResB n=1 Tax=Ralstonia solanacearum TaxID=305 RepID=A0A0S4TTL5_RALSL|nr:cytochrome c biogenesis protein ResB [Ralstonia pseudosolanacearum]OAI81585.1 cytochrome C biogenesis protein ResB [Ralstonia solanacearum]QCX49758.1 cytochrome c biogenesis protein ResB [Ralstonia pseudosolanacearum]CUV13408.1 Cytochrome c-type biogenesis protein Ccs1/ResB [Ralstonia solanacearum]